MLRVASQPTTAVTGRWVGERNPESEDEGQDNLDDCLAIEGAASRWFHRGNRR